MSKTHHMGSKPCGTYACGGRGLLRACGEVAQLTARTRLGPSFPQNSIHTERPCPTHSALGRSSEEGIAWERGR
jgi:hypothetical protein